MATPRYILKPDSEASDRHKASLEKMFDSLLATKKREQAFEMQLALQERQDRKAEADRQLRREERREDIEADRKFEEERYQGRLKAQRQYATDTRDELRIHNKEISEITRYNSAKGLFLRSGGTAEGIENIVRKKTGKKKEDHPDLDLSIEGIGNKHINGVIDELNEESFSKVKAELDRQSIEGIQDELLRMGVSASELEEKPGENVKQRKDRLVAMVFPRTKANAEQAERDKFKQTAILQAQVGGVDPEIIKNARDSNEEDAVSKLVAAIDQRGGESILKKDRRANNIGEVKKLNAGVRYLNAIKGEGWDIPLLKDEDLSDEDKVAAHRDLVNKALVKQKKKEWRKDRADGEVEIDNIVHKSISGNVAENSSALAMLMDKEERGKMPLGVLSEEEHGRLEEAAAEDEAVHQRELAAAKKAGRPAKEKTNKNLELTAKDIRYLSFEREDGQSRLFDNYISGRQLKKNEEAIKAAKLKPDAQGLMSLLEIKETRLAADAFARINRIDGKFQTFMDLPYKEGVTGAVMSDWSVDDTAALTPTAQQPSLFPTEHPYVTNPDGSVSNVKTITYESGGKHYVIPSMVNGKQLSNPAAVKVAKEQGLEKYPVFGTAKEALEASKELHDKQQPDRMTGDGSSLPLHPDLDEQGLGAGWWGSSAPVTVESDGRHYVIPSMVGGKQLSGDEAWEVAKEQGLEKYPVFGTAKEALEASKELHDKQQPDRMTGDGSSLPLHPDLDEQGLGAGWWGSSAPRSPNAESDALAKKIASATAASAAKADLSNLPPAAPIPSPTDMDAKVDLRNLPSITPAPSPAPPLSQSYDVGRAQKMSLSGSALPSYTPDSLPPRPTPSMIPLKSRQWLEANLDRPSWYGEEPPEGPKGPIVPPIDPSVPPVRRGIPYGTEIYPSVPPVRRGLPYGTEIDPDVPPVRRGIPYGTEIYPSVPPVRRGLPYGTEIDPDVPPVRRGIPYGSVVEDTPSVYQSLPMRQPSAAQRRGEDRMAPTNLPPSPYARNMQFDGASYQRPASPEARSVPSEASLSLPAPQGAGAPPGEGRWLPTPQGAGAPADLAPSLRLPEEAPSMPMSDGKSERDLQIEMILDKLESDPSELLPFHHQFLKDEYGEDVYYELMRRAYSKRTQSLPVPGSIPPLPMGIGPNLPPPPLNLIPSLPGLEPNLPPPPRMLNLPPRPRPMNVPPLPR